MKLLLLMTTGMSLRRWAELGQISRELKIYQKLGEKVGHIYIHSYGKNEENLVKNYPNVTVLSKPNFIPEWRIRPKRINRYFNYIYNFITPFFRISIYRKIDIIKTNQFRGALWGVVLKCLFGCKLVTRMGYYHNHFKPLSFRIYCVEKIVFRASDFIIVTESNAKAFIEKKYGLKTGIVQHIPNYIDTNIFSYKDSNKHIDVFYVGRLEAKKNLDGLLRALKNIPAKIVFIGDGPKRKDLFQIAESNGLNLCLIKKVENHHLPDYYNQAKVFALPSFYEGNPKVLLEAMACGCAVIGSNVNGINNIIEHKVNGYLCETDFRSIRNAICEVLKDQRLMKNMGLNAVKYIRKNNVLDVLIDQEKQLYWRMEGKFSVINKST